MRPPAGSAVTRRLRAAQRQLQRAETALAQARRTLREAEARVSKYHGLLTAMAAAPSPVGEHAAPVKHPPVRGVSPPQRRPSRLPDTRISAQPPVSSPRRPQRAPVTAQARATALRQMTALLPATLTTSIAGRSRTLALHAGKHYVVQPLNRRRTKHAGLVGTLVSWDMGGTTAMLRLRDGTMLPVRLADLVQSPG